MKTYTNDVRTTSTDVGLLLIRGVVGLVLAYHGSQKLFGAFGGYGFKGFAGFVESIGAPLPTVSAALAVAAEFGGGLLLALGLGVRLITWPMAFTMAVAVYALRAKGFDAQGGGFEYAFTLGVVLIGLAFTGGGRLSADRLIAERNREPKLVVAIA